VTALHTLAAFLVLNGVEPTAATADCLPDDNGCKARRSEQRAASAPTPDQRATYLRSAHRSYLFLFDKTGDVLDLCSARRTFDASLAVKDQSADERARTRVLRDDLVARERKTGATCKGVAKQRRASKSDTPPVVAGVRNRKAPPDPPARTDLTGEPPPLLTNAATIEPATRARTAAIGESIHRRRRSCQSVPTTMPCRSPPGARHRGREHADGPRPGRGLVIAGGVTLGAGVVLTAAAGYLGRRMSETRQQYFAIVDMVGGGFGTDDQDATAGGLFHDYNVMRTQALTLALAGGATIVLAAVLAGVGGRRMARAASRTALVPVPGGLALHARF
jgi:hypothetical protein